MRKLFHSIEKGGAVLSIKVCGACAPLGGFNGGVFNVRGGRGASAVTVLFYYLRR